MDPHDGFVFDPTSRIAFPRKAFDLLDRAIRGVWSFRIALRSEPIYAAAALHPLVKVGLARQALDVPDFRTGTVGLDLPVALRDAFRLEDDPDSRRFSHTAVYDLSCSGRKPQSGPSYSN